MLPDHLLRVTRRQRTFDERKMRDEIAFGLGLCRGFFLIQLSRPQVITEALLSKKTADYVIFFNI